MLLNTGFSGPQCWLLLAIARGHVDAAGVELDLTPGSGAFNAAPGLAAGGYDLAYGDIHALVEVAARDRDAPIGVYATFDASPSCIALPRGSAIAAPRDLAGARMIGHASDVALRTFGAFCAATGLARDAVAVLPAEGAMAALADRVLAGEAEGLFCYASTLAAALAAQGRDAEAEFRQFRYADLVPDLHGSAVMASRALVRDHPAALRALLTAFDRGLEEALADPDAAIEVVLRFAPGADARVERLRWDATLAVEMGRGEGFGAVDPARFTRGVALHATSLGLAPPDPAALFTDAFLPPHRAAPR
ncbi:ABC transporter substrate-binding protein [Falsiroseomonas sp. HW251]|uniref:ABC transporter substrate-binding protein n=1 Tax=Falsiroseomonas sp. HW251 TaxID=3390998 RepID=UPI003D317268